MPAGHSNLLFHNPFLIHGLVILFLSRQFLNSISSELSYELHLRPLGIGDCFGVARKLEVIEFSIRSGNSSAWTPLQLHYFDHLTSTTTTEVIRGNSAKVTSSPSTSVAKQVFVCGDLLSSKVVQFRWMGSAYFDSSIGESLAKHDVWALSNVSASLVTESENITLFRDSFGSDVLK